MGWRPLLDALFPPQCASCNAPGSALCNACLPHPERIRIYLPRLTVTAYGSYEGALRAAVLALKDGRRDVGEALGQLLAPLIARGAILVPVPTTARRRRVRGFDGVVLLAGSAAAVAGACVLDALEQRRGDTQRGRSRDERLAAHGRFSCNARIAARRITLIDDVCTTGSTLRDCAAAVREAAGVVEDAVVVAVTKSGAWRAMPTES